MSAYASIRAVLIAYRTISATPRTPIFPTSRTTGCRLGSWQAHAQPARNANGLTTRTLKAAWAILIQNFAQDPLV